MKKILLILLLSIPIFTYAQSDSTKNHAKEEYCMLIATAKFMSAKVNITVDFGQETHLFAFKDTRLKDDTGKVVTFNSVIDALNYMSTQGWEFVNAYALSEGSGGKVLNYVMRRKI
jgi:hypothetical protein